MIVYKTVNKTNGQIYVGQDSKDDSRYLGSGILLNEAIRKYGKENFEKEMIAWCYTKEHLDFLEKFYIKFFNSKVPNGYNLTDGGDGTLGYFPDEQIKEKMSLSHKKFYDSHPEATRRLAESIKKIWQNPAYKEILSRSQKISQNKLELKQRKSKFMQEVWNNSELRTRYIEGMNKSDAKQKNSKAKKEMWESPGFRENYSEIMKATMNKTEVKEKLRKAMKGKNQSPKSEETKRRMKEAWIKRKAKKN